MANVCTETTPRFFIFFLLVTQSYANFNGSSSDHYNMNHVVEIEVGVIVDMGSLIGKTIHACISMAISDFYESNSHYKTRIILHARDSQGKSLRALLAAADLLKNIRPHAILGLETSVDKLLALMTEKAKIPTFSFSPTFTFPTDQENPYMVKIRSDEAFQFEGIATIVQSLELDGVVLIFEDGVDQNERKNIHKFSPTSVTISSSDKDQRIIKQLHNLMILDMKTYIVHMSLSLAYRLVTLAKRLGMMKDEYTWIITDLAMNSLHPMDIEVIESLRGTFGFKPSIASSSSGKLHNMPIVGIWAYDTMQALAEAVERVAVDTLDLDDHNARIGSLEWLDFVHSQGGMLLLHEIRRVRFDGLSGEYEFGDGKLYPQEFNLVKIVQGHEEKVVGIWRPKEGILIKELNTSMGSMNSTGDPSNTIISPRECEVTHRGRRFLQKTSPSKLRIGVPMKLSFRELVDVRYDPQTNRTTFSGYCISVFKSALEYLPYEVVYEFVPLLNGSYNDYVDKVYYKDIDGLVGDVTISANRSLIVDFTVPFTDLGVGTLSWTRDDIWSYLRPLDTTLWLASGAFFLLTGFIVWTVERANNNHEFKQGSMAFQIGTIFWFGLSTMVFAHRERLTSNLSRIVVLVWVFAVFVLTSSYTATLSSLLTVQQIQIGSAGEFIGTQYGSSVNRVHLNFQDASFKRYGSPEDYAAALSQGHKNGGVDAIIDEVPYIKIVLAKYSRDIFLISSSSTTGGFGFVFPKGSPLTSDMSRAIMRLREEGELLKKERTWFNAQSSLLPEGAMATKNNKLNFYQFGGLFLVCGICLAAVIAIHLIQLLLKRFKLQSHYISNSSTNPTRKHSISSSSTTGGFGFVFPKGSPLNSDMSRAIMRSREEGELLEKERTWFKAQSSLLPDRDMATNNNQQKFYQFGGICGILFVGFV